METENNIIFRTPYWVWVIIALNVILLAGVYMTYTKISASETRNIVRDMLQHTKYSEPTQDSKKTCCF